MQIAAQILGIVASIIAIISFQMRKKWQMLIVGMIANLLSMIVFLMLNGLTSAVTVNLIAVLQCGINAYLSYNGKVASLIQKIVFTVLFLVSGFLEYAVLLDLLPILASILFMTSTFQKNEQNIRIWSALNVSVWVIYDVIVGTTAVFGQIFSLVSILIALYRYREKPSNEENL